MLSNKLTVGILAHVDAGKTTLSETMLYLTGSIRKMGRVDHKDAFLDTFELEKTRGITIFSKQAVFQLGDMEATLLDTPGHVDFSSEMERTLQVLDYAILVISGADGIQGHTQTIWKLLKRYGVPTFIFVNKMDQVGADREKLLKELRSRLGEGCIDFGETESRDGHWNENLAVCDEHLLESFLETGELKKDDIARAIAKYRIFPAYFGSALKNSGVQDLLDGMEIYTRPAEYADVFGARVFKISRDDQGNRLTHVKITGGSLKVKDAIDEEGREKVDQIRIYSGKQYDSVQEASAGSICALTGLSTTHAGDGLGFESGSVQPELEPVLSYRIELPESCNVHGMLQNLKVLEEEEPHLNIVWNETLEEIHAKVMGEIEIEILKSLILDRFGIEVTFGSGNLVYKETIKKPTLGIGHFEPLKHYAEVHLLMEPAESGSGIQLATACSEDVLGGSWQRLILTHLAEKPFNGVLTGSEITDMKITVVAGRAHEKHTEGGDFRQATFRAVRQGLMKAESILLEPVYIFRLELPKEFLGKAMSDVQRMYGRHDEPSIDEENAILTGTAPVSTMMHYSLEVAGYTKGTGRLALSPGGYEPCHNAEDVIADKAYDPEKDASNPSGSVFCSHGAGFNVPWDEVEDYKHVDSGLKLNMGEDESTSVSQENLRSYAGSSVTSDEELEAIFLKTYGPSKRESLQSGHSSAKRSDPVARMRNQNFVKRDKYLLVDGYNIIFAWDNLKELARESLEAARMKLMDMMCNYQALRAETVILVFDAYKVKGNPGSVTKYHNINVVYTKEAETADQYIEKLTNEISPRYDVTVATSDAVEQIIIMGKGAKRLSAEGFKAEMDDVYRIMREEYLEK